MTIEIPKWLEGMLVAAAGGALGAAGDAYASGHTEVSHLKGAAISGAAIGLLAWLRQSPIQKMPDTKQEPPKS